MDAEARGPELRSRGVLSRSTERALQADGNIAADQGQRLDKLASVRQKVSGRFLVSVACVSLNERIYPRIPRRTQLSKPSKVALGSH